MDCKIVKPFLTAAGMFACGAVGYVAARKGRAGINNAMENTSKSCLAENCGIGKEDETGISIRNGRLDENVLRRCLLNMFWMYDYEEFKKFGGCTSDDADLREFAAGYYAPALYEYMRKNMEIVFKMDGDDGTGEEPFEMSDTLFYVPACRICSMPEEVMSGQFWLLQEKELWVLEDGRAASVYCLSFDKDGWKLVYRFLDRYIQMPSDLTVPFQELESGLAKMMGA